MLAIILGLLCDHCVTNKWMYQWLKETLFYRYFTELILDSFGNEPPLNKISNYVSAIIINLLSYNDVMIQWIKSHTIC